MLMHVACITQDAVRKTMHTEQAEFNVELGTKAWKGLKCHTRV